MCTPLAYTLFARSETALWELSRDRLRLDLFLDRYGYHGPAEGQVASASWREDPSPVHALVALCDQHARRDAPYRHGRPRAGGRRSRHGDPARREGRRLMARTTPSGMGPRAGGRVPALAPGESHRTAVEGHLLFVLRDHLRSRMI